MVHHASFIIYLFLILTTHKVIKNYLLKILFILFLTACNHTKRKKVEYDSIYNKYNNYLLYKKDLISENSKDSIKNIILNLPEDTLKEKLLFEISYHYLIQNDSLNFKLWNSRTRQLSINLNDSTKIAESYWDLASFWYTRNVIDSAYYNYNKAYNIYSLAGDKFQASRMMLSMAKMQTNIKDYLGSEISTINSLKTLIPLKKFAQIYSAYNNLGIIYNELGMFEKSLSFHTKALNVEEKLNDELLKASSYNNIGVVYQNSSQYNLSIDFFKKALHVDSLYYKNTGLYAMLVDNLAYSRLKLKDTTGIFGDFQRAMIIRDSINNPSGLIINKLHLVDYFLFKNDKLQAFQQVLEAKSMAEKYNSYGDLQQSLLLLTKIDSTNANQYYSKYISLNDSLQNEERLIRNKFARIRFETDQYISENKYLSKKNQNILFLLGFVVFLFIITFLIRNQKIKYDKLKSLNQQQLANEEIYNLLLDSQNKLDEGREKEKSRISKELHDGILSKFFGVRLNLEILNDGIDIDSIRERKKYIHELKQLEKEIRSVSHQLNYDMFSLDNNFLKILKELFDTQCRIGSIQYRLNIDENISWDEISNKIKINIYRTLQEGLHNICKYSKANFVQLLLQERKDFLEVILNDNGVGFDIKSKMNTNGIGLSNIKSRIENLKGKLIITSNNSGTTISMKIPIKKV